MARRGAAHVRSGTSLAELQGRAALLGPKRGPVLFQLPPTFPLDLPRLVAFHAGRAPGGGFEAKVLREWAGRLRGVLRSGLDAYVYFNNDRDGHAVRDARSLTALLQRDRSP